MTTIPKAAIKAADLTRPIIDIENRTAQEVFEIMCDRIRMATNKPATDLEWEPAADSPGAMVAITADGPYYAWDNGSYGYWCLGRDVGKEVYGGIAAAKAAAYRDHKVRHQQHLAPPAPALPEGCIRYADY